MLWTFIRFELKFWLRGWMVWIFQFIIGLMVFGAASSDKVIVGGALGNTWRNAAWVIQNFYAVMGLLTLLMTTAFVNSAASRDFAYNTHLMIFSSPLRRRDYLLGRFLGSALVAVIPMLGVSLGIIIARFMPWIDPERWGPVMWGAHLAGILVFALPNTLFIAAIIFAIAAWTRSTVTSFIGALLLLTGYTVADVLTQDIERETYAMILDPFAIRTFSLLTKYWTVAEKNTQSLGLVPMMLANRALWLSVSALIFGVTAWRFSFSERASSQRRWLRRKAVSEPAAKPGRSLLPPLEVGAGSAWARLSGTFRNEFQGLVKSVSFIVITIAALLNCLPNLIYGATEMYGNTTLPVTYAILEVIEGTLYIFLISMITFYAGVLVWRERDAQMADIHDALPTPTWIGYAAKLAALLGSLMIILTVAGLAGMLVQRFQGYTQNDVGQYAYTLYVRDLSMFLLLAVLAFFFHVVSPNKYIGYFAFIGFLIANAFIWAPMKVATRMVRYASRPSVTYSEFYGHAPDTVAWSWFTVYWLLFAGLLAAASILLWQRGRDTDWGSRWREAQRRFTGPVRVATLGCLMAFGACAGWLFYNTKVLNRVVDSSESDDIAAEYEKLYKKYEGMAQPRVTAVRYEIDLYPETRNARMKAEQTIENRAQQALTEMHLNMPNPDFDVEVAVDGMKLDKDDKRHGYRIYKIDPPMQPGEKRTMKFTVASRVRGIANGIPLTQFAQNGTFFNNTIAPQIGYQPGEELGDRNERKKRGLKEKALLPPLERDCTAHCMNTYISNNSDWVMVETVISTPEGQIAIAPGSLEKEWSEKGRRYFAYKLDHASLNFYSFLSANYQVAREEWNGIKIEIYYLKQHPYNVPKMIAGVKQALDYLTKNFGPYAHKQARIIEFPRVASFAQAFPGTMPYSEAIGFIAKLDKPDDIDQVFYIVAHEMAHQWWAHQVIGASMQGATLLSETLAQYSALMVMEKQYGRDTMRKFLRYEMDRYLRSRGRERLRERPLLKVDADQGYIHYQKGSVVMYYLKEMIGEEAVNRALRKMIERFGYAQPPYPTSHDLVALLRAETPPDLQYLIKDLFEEMTLFSNRTLSAKSTKRSDGKYDVEIEIEAKKFKADHQGTEKEVPVDDWIEIGAFAKPAKDKKYGATLYRERVKLKDGKSAHKFTVASMPYEAGVDPFLLLVDRFPDDNLKKLE